MQNTLSDKLYAVVKTLRGHSRITEANSADMLRQVRMALLEADVNLQVVKTFVEKLKTAAQGEEVIGSLTPGQAMVGVVLRELIVALGGGLPPEQREINLRTRPPAVVHLVGLQGAGKTTTAGKLAHYLQRQKKKVLLVSVDVYRPAAIKQLETLSKQVGVDFFAADTSQTPVAIAQAALLHARQQAYDVLIVDSAGRTSIDSKMMAEMVQVGNLLAPIETFFVLDAMMGQEANKTALAFHEAVNLTGIIVTKTDSDARGGAVLSVQSVTNLPVKFIGVSERVNGLQSFDPERMARQILGMGDVLAIVEEAQENLSIKEAEKLAEKLKKNKDFDLNDFRIQLAQMGKMGGLQQMVEKLPKHLQGNKSLGTGQLQQAEKQFVRMRGIIDAMTPQERQQPDILKASRKRRVAKGAGVQVFEVNQLINQFDQMRQMMKKMGGGKMLKNLSRFGGGLGGALGAGLAGRSAPRF